MGTWVLARDQENYNHKKQQFPHIHSSTLLGGNTVRVMKDPFPRYKTSFPRRMGISCGL